MIKATQSFTTHHSYLDSAIIRVAAAKVRELVNEGHCPKAALWLATPGSWAEYQGAVVDYLSA